jgi:GNAT superfamily N-acetyltransferase
LGLLLLKESEQGHGYGHAAFREVEKLVRTWPEITTFRLGVVEANKVVLGFWLKQGFLLTEKTAPYEHKSVRSRVLILEKPL